MAEQALRAPVRVVNNPLEASIKATNRQIAARVVTDYVADLCVERLCSEIATALDAARPPRGDRSVWVSYAARDAAREIEALPRDELDFTAQVRAVVLRYLVGMMMEG